MSRLISDAEIKRRKKAQAHISQATGALGLTALGGTLAASRGGRTALRKVPGLKNKIAAPKPLKPDRDRIKGAVTPVLATSAGLGGLGAFNFASYTSAESRKRKQGVVKSMGIEPGYYGDEGHQGVIEKAWEPMASNFDPEAKRHKRSQRYETALGGAAGGAAGGGALYAGKALALESKNRKPGQVRAKHFPAVKAAQAARRAKSVKHGKTAAGLAGASAVAAAGAAGVRRQRKKSWESYGKRDTTSAFGVDHE